MKRESSQRKRAVIAALGPELAEEEVPRGRETASSGLPRPPSSSRPRSPSPTPRPPRRPRGKAVQDQLSGKVFQLLHFQHAPDYLKDNKFIYTGYRAHATFLDAFLSIFKLHNETGNIWSHLLGFSLFAALTAAIASRVSLGEITTRIFVRSRHSHVLDDLLHLELPHLKVWPMYTFMAGAMYCMLVSAAAHTFWCCGKTVSRVVWRFDYAGIASLIVGSFYPSVYYGLLCNPMLQRFYLTAITLLGGATVYVSLSPAFQSASYHSFRAGIFTSLALFGIFPLITFTYINRQHKDVLHACFLDLAMGACYLSGVSMYALRIPERWLPGLVDHFGHSHQLFHILIVIAAYLHYESAVILMRWRSTVGCSAERSYDHVLARLLQEVGREIESGARKVAAGLMT